VSMALERGMLRGATKGKRGQTLPTRLNGENEKTLRATKEKRKHSTGIGGWRSWLALGPSKKGKGKFGTRSRKGEGKGVSKIKNQDRALSKTHKGRDEGRVLA